MQKAAVINDTEEVPVIATAIHLVEDVQQNPVKRLRDLQEVGELCR